MNAEADTKSRAKIVVTFIVDEYDNWKRAINCGKKRACEVALSDRESGAEERNSRKQRGSEVLAPAPYVHHVEATSNFIRLCVITWLVEGISRDLCASVCPSFRFSKLKVSYVIAKCSKKPVRIWIETNPLIPSYQILEVLSSIFYRALSDPVGSSSKFVVELCQIPSGNRAENCCAVTFRNPTTIPVFVTKPKY